MKINNDQKFYLSGILNIWILSHIIFAAFWPFAYMMGSLAKLYSLYPSILLLSISWTGISLIMAFIMKDDKRKKNGRARK